MKPRPGERFAPATAQRGAALVIGLILLLILTLLAVAGMNSASSELVMAGNEQYRQNAFQAADTGIEQALIMLPTIPQNGVPRVVDNTDVPNSTAGDQYRSSSVYVGTNPSLTNFSAGKYVGLHYNINSTGTSARNASANHIQGAYIIQSTGGVGSFGSIN